MSSWLVYDLTGQTFGRLTVGKRIGYAKGTTWWNATCTCGSDTIVTTLGLRRARKPVQSCGCVTREATALRFAALRPPTVDGRKPCRVCGEHRPLSDYYRRDETADGRQSMCKSCFIADATARKRRRAA